MCWAVLERGVLGLECVKDLALSGLSRHQNRDLLKKHQRRPSTSPLCWETAWFVAVLG